MDGWKPNLEKEKKPIYKALVEKLEEDINSGLLKPGQILPPQRELADYLGINLSTITRAFRVCELKGLISGVVGRGTFVAMDSKLSLTLYNKNQNDIIEMGQVHPLYSMDQGITTMVNPALQEMDMESLIRYTEPEGHRRHRAVGADWLKTFNLDANEDEIIVTPGSQNAMANCFLTLFNAGDRIAVDTLTYPGIKTLAAFHGIRLVPISMTQEGMDPHSLLEACKQDKITGIYLMPEVQNPTSYSMSEDVREKIAGIITRYNLILIEDDAYNYLGNKDSVPLSAYVPSNSIYIGGTSKLLGPGFRISFVKVAKPYLNSMRKGLLNTSWMASPITAELASHLIITGKSETIKELKRTEARKRNKMAIQILSSYDVSSRECGFYQWITLPTGWTGRQFEMVAKEAGVQVFCAEKFAVGANEVPPAIRISLSGPETREELEKGLLLIKEVLQKGFDYEEPFGIL
ncbi:aminotransferase class I/II-fold pyridoxal phosphate-dependent enzyme [Aquibacillus halophilus]|uniref:Aminotransferase class I/II-fold pyridoxal phosphate-dependent enzyme n=1 Tax=Aquibacillus halophilus TaxID=930132 RepID=A0A6A8DA36_9BACI|nr:PLP-dependent aminotransferase family protein [Aquibacillus halophilus]MRH41396.1 aminotransferase class I/II-fold pyridoxal phosphate-dependent enzyme [Aquibacillus halophilus]